jgi:hypothetical protein
MDDDRDEEEVREFETLKRNVLEAMQEALKGSSWAPPGSGLIVEAVVCMVWMQPDGKNGISVFPATHHWWSTSGILMDSVQQHQGIRGSSSEPDEY